MGPQREAPRYESGSGAHRESAIQTCGKIQSFGFTQDFGQKSLSREPLSRDSRASSNADEPRRIPVFVVVPPRLLLLDIAGPLEVLRQANRVQGSVRFEVVYIGPQSSVQSSIGVRLSGIDPLPNETSTRTA